MEIFIEKMTLTNFKGIKSFTADFTKESFVYGDNATGKTTLFDAFKWLLFGKDSADRKDFNIKPLDASGKCTDKVDCEVSATLNTNGVAMNLRRVFHEKWQTKKGEAEQEFTCNETLYFWNDVPMQQKEYMSKIETLVDESVFKLITDPLYFNSLPWKDRRNVLLSIAGQIDDQEVLDSIAFTAGGPSLAALSEILASGKTLSEYKKEVAAKKKKAVDEAKTIPSRIDEAVRSKPEDTNFDAVRKSIERLNKEVAGIDDQISDRAKAAQGKMAEISAKQQEVFKVKSDISATEHRIREEIRDRVRKEDAEPLRIRREIGETEQMIGTAKAKVHSLTEKTKILEDSLQPTRDQWTAENEREIKFKDGEFHCPACKRELEANDVEAKKEELITNFNRSKQEKLASISSKGKMINAEISQNKEIITSTEAQIIELEGKLAELKEAFRLVAAGRDNRQSENAELHSTLISDFEYCALIQKRDELQSEFDLMNQALNDPESDELNRGLKEKKSELSSKLGELNQVLAREEQIKRTDKRIEELREQERSLAQLISDYDGAEFIADQFTKAKMNILESRINDRFNIARFRMFKPQVNGGEEETCDTTVNGVPWADTNTAAKIQAGIDIINVLSDHYKVHGPIWIDNRESTVSIPFTESQVINLVVSPVDPKLRIENREVAYA